MTDANVAAQDADAPQFSLGKVYLKDASVEAPNSPAAFINTADWDPKVTLEYRIETAELPDDAYEVALTLTVSATDGERTLFLVEIKQGGIFLIRNIKNQEAIPRFLNVRCPRTLFPYAREAVDNLVVKAGFPPLMLSPLDFKADYEQRTAADSEGETIQ